MHNLNKEHTGWLQAFINVIVFWGLSNVFMSYCTQTLEVNKVIFALATYSACSLCLLLYAGHGKLSKETMRSFDTWGYGIIMLLNYFITLNLFSLTTAAEASLIQRFSVVFSVFISWFFLLRKPSRYQLVGLSMIFCGVIYILKQSPDDKIFYLSILMLLAGIFQSLRIFIAEFHRPNKKAAEDNSIKTRCRVIGYVMFVITLIFGSMVGFATYMQEYVPEVYRVNFIVDLEDLFSYKSIFCGMIMGVFIYTPIRYLEFSASEKIKTENYLTVTALSFFSTIFWEWSTSGITGLSLKEFSTEAFIAGVIITAGALIMSLAKILQKNPLDYSEFIKLETQDLHNIEESRELLANALEHFNSDFKKVGLALNLPVPVLKSIFNDTTKKLSFTPDTLKVISRNYRKNIANSDSLTGLLNRNGFMTNLKIASLESENLSLFFIDLNKFKPVNDTYGHEAGDYVLQESAKRLKELFPEKSLITRLGGDEYCILLIDTVKKAAEEKINSILQVLEQDFNYKENIINISGSIGLASFPEDTQTPEELLEIADKQMYINKSER